MEIKNILKKLAYICIFLAVFTLFYGFMETSIFGSYLILILIVILFISVSFILLALSEILEWLHFLTRQK
ncbi:hypothetical protein [Caloranaerobacter azorensis]|uniref:Uncharacterized protein n=3 Tax=Caloranaerobacter azorensis TaxID=116090 RepID=A0A1M5WEE6_9FIRM|nr:hypothetical protein [Caloranaerobacter azorensis]KGG79905.1 hypothetical protein Y919_09230 [Caloranaerobacter azorensis H53214]QIB25929.1 hypothetical protein G3A45_00505 [Caloranaerobacter azorensis]SHH85768.1 hypothetical protein SAMN02745135_02434 [Caloranaerobacter azorensis DSM 13643]